MKTEQILDEHLRRMDGRGYKAYKEIKGEYQFPGFTLLIDHVQGDPFATHPGSGFKSTEKPPAFPGRCLKTIAEKLRCAII